jgi:AraC family transcriptional regulator of adaptative response/methylated-DNA-[protein]-cysteine methyltransferase
MNVDFSEASQDYARIARVIAHVRSRAGAQPELAELAGAAGLSEGHLQRVFTRWAGISPKRFLQVLTLDAARERLRRGGAAGGGDAGRAGGADLLAAALDSGLSGPGRLHDLFVNLTAFSPGEFAAGGARVVLRHGVADTPFGPAFFAWSERGLAALEFISIGATDTEEAARARLRADWPDAALQAAAGGAAEWAARVFPSGGRGPERGLSLWVRGTNFQVRVWRALLRIPPGAAVSYGTLAGSLGLPGGARAAGGAVGANPVAWLIPCHRVLRADGADGGYRWGVERKLAMAVREAGSSGAAL